MSFTAYSQTFKDYQETTKKQLAIVEQWYKNLESNNAKLSNQQKQIDVLTKGYNDLLNRVEALENYKPIDTIIEDTVIVPLPTTKGLAFSSAKGAGAYATGGRGGQVIRVSTLCYDCEGGLKEAIQTKGKRIIVFDVSGVIDATSQGEYSYIIKGEDYDNLTIAGQSAPHGGITILTKEFMFQDVSNVVIRNIRFRGTTWTRDSFWMHGGKDIMISNCTFSYGGDESASLASGFGRTSDPNVIMENVTIQNCFFQDSKTGTILGTANKDGNFTFINNVYSNISHRTPNAKGSGQYDIINNVVYNWKYRLSRFGDGVFNGKVNLINNYYKGSKNGINQSGWFVNYDIPARYLYKLQVSENDTPLIYASGSVIYNQRKAQESDNDMFSIFAGSYLPEHSTPPSNYFTNKMFDLIGNPYEIKSAEDTYITVLENVGANTTLNADGSINYYQDDKDSEAIEMIKSDGYNGNFYNGDTRFYPTIPENIRHNNFDSNNDGIPNELQHLLPSGKKASDIDDETGWSYLELIWLNRI